MWFSEGLTVEAFGVAVGLDLTGGLSREVIDAVRAAWKDARVEDVSEPDLVVQVSDAAPESLDALLESLSVRVTLKALEHCGGSALLFHAAGIAAPDGRVIAFVGPSGRGKTTISRNLAKHYGYVSDETIAVDFDLTVRAYRKPLSLKRDPRPKEQVAPSALGLLELPEVPLALTRLIVLYRHEEATAPYVEHMDILDSINVVLPETSYLINVPHPLQQLANLGERTGGILRLHYSEAADLIDFIPSILEMESSAGGWENGLATSEREFADRVRGGSVVPSDVVDAICAEDRVLLLKNDRIAVMLHGVGPGIWDAAKLGLTFDETIEYVDERYGVPEGLDVRGTLESMIDECVDAGILQRV